MSYILAGIVAEPELAQTLIFKGGTALKKLYFGDYRFSEDLDFSVIKAPKGDNLETAIHHSIENAKNFLSEYGLFTIQVARYQERDPHPHGQEAFIIRVQFPWHSTSLCRVKLEISHDEPVILEPDSRPLIHGYEEELAPYIKCYKLEEIIAEKMRCLLQTHAKLLLRGWNRPRTRDYYDLWRILTTYGLEVNKAKLLPILKQKCEHRKVYYIGLEDFFTKELVTEAQTHWDSSLRPFMHDLLDFDLVLNELKVLVSVILKHPD